MLKITLFISFVLVTTMAMAQPSIGSVVPDIALPDADGETRKLSTLRGKIVLVDFWASWCGPCRKSNKELAALYSKYKDKGFEIYAVSLDSDKRDWLTAIKNDKINWIQVIESAGWESQVSLKWRVEQLPTSFLIDKDGMLLAIDPAKSKIEFYLKRNLTSKP